MVRMVANGYIINADLPLPEQKYPKNQWCWCLEGRILLRTGIGNE